MYQFADVDAQKFQSTKNKPPFLDRYPEVQKHKDSESRGGLTGFKPVHPENFLLMRLFELVLERRESPPGCKHKVSIHLLGEQFSTMHSSCHYCTHR